MLVNLLTNAVKFTPNGGSITLAAAGKCEKIRLSVSDTGIGIPADKQEQVMQPFQQVDASLARSDDGLGLGLPLTRHLAEAHGGMLELESTEGVGPRITLMLPLVPEDV